MSRIFTPNRPPIQGVTHMVSSGHYLASAAGYRVLEEGGNAVDAGVATGIVLNVTLPHWTSFGGVAPIMIYSAESQEVVTISGLGRWPKAATLDYLLELGGGDMPGMLKNVIPAACDAWLTALEKYGSMTFEQVVTPALELCEQGFVVQGTLARHLPLSRELFEANPTLRQVFMSNGRVMGERDVLVQRDLGKTFRRLIEVERSQSHQGRQAAIRAARDYFYKGDIAHEMAEFSESNGGLITYEDISEFRVKLEQPETGEFKGLTVFTCGPWCQGPSLIEVLNILEGFDLKGMGHNSPDYVHTLAETINLAFADRHYYVGDPEFVPVPTAGLLSKEYANDRRGALDMARAWPEMPEPGDPFQYQPGPRPEFQLARKPVAKEGAELRDTSYLCVVDRWGNAISATPSDGYGTPFVPGLGFSISGRGTQSWLEEDHPSCVAPGKRPRLTPNPAMALKDGKPYMVFGTPGADVQVQAMTQLLLNVVEFGMDPQQAIEAPRFSSYNYPQSFWPHSYLPGLLCVEPSLGRQVSEDLSARGHRMRDWEERDFLAGGLCAIKVDQDRGTLSGGADFRRECYAMGR